MAIERLLDNWRGGGGGAWPKAAGGRPGIDLITHGMPFPIISRPPSCWRRRCAANGAVPATVAVVDGRLRAGLDRPTLERLARLSGASSRPRGAIFRPSPRAAAWRGRRWRRRCSFPRSRHRDFRDGRHRRRASGRGGDFRTFRPISSNSRAARSPSSAPAPNRSSTSPRRWSFLESQGVADHRPIAANEFPAFFARTSGVKLDHRCDGAQ